MIVILLSYFSLQLIKNPILKIDFCFFRKDVIH